jgi:glycine betaine/proline transport system substrate-binding protein
LPRIFISYAREQLELVKTLVDDLDHAEIDVSFDQDLSGGHIWWDRILEQIRKCDIFAFVLSPESRESVACSREFKYAEALGKTVLPILLVDGVRTSLLPPSLTKINFVDYHMRDARAGIRLTRAITACPPSPPLPDPLPPSPEAPISPLGQLAEMVEQSGVLSPDDQMLLIGRLEEELDKPESRQDALELFAQFRRRRDVSESSAKKIDAIFAQNKRQTSGGSDSLRNIVFLCAFLVGLLLVVLVTLNFMGFGFTQFVASKRPDTPSPPASGTVTAIPTSTPAAASPKTEPQSCRTVRVADVGWVDNAAQNGLFNTVLKGLGYQPKIDNVALPLILDALKANQLDFFLDNWMPSNAADVQPYLDAKSIDSLQPSLTGAGYGPVVPDYVAAAGVNDIKDLDANKDKFGAKFYGIDPGTIGNKLIQTKIDDPRSGMGSFKLVESSEPGMLAQVEKAMDKQEWVVFFGMTPHPVMGHMKLVFLTGFEKDRFGDAKINTLTRPGFVRECANVGKLLSNLSFTVPMISDVMNQIGNENDAEGAAKAWLKKEPSVLEGWLNGVTTFDGHNGLDAVKRVIAN